MNIHKKRLLITPLIKYNEILEGYIYRLAKVNGYEIDIFHMFNRYLKRVSVEDSVLEITEVLEKVTGHNKEYFECNKLEHLPNKILVNKKVAIQEIRYCPLCLNEDQYFRVDWTIKYISFCEKHNLILNNSCTNCSKKLSIIEIVYCQCNQCSQDLRRSQINLLESDNSFFPSNLSFFSLEQIWHELDSKSYFLFLSIFISAYSLIYGYRNGIVHGYVADLNNYDIHSKDYNLVASIIFPKLRFK